MNLKEWLSEIKKLDTLISLKQMRIEELWSVATYPGVSYEPRVQSSPNFNKRTDTICKIIEIEAEIKQMQAELKKRQNEIREVLNQFEDEKTAKVIYLRYIEFKDWNYISKEIGYSRRWTMKLHNKGLKNLSFLLQFT